MRNIVIIGPTGSGKSTVGPLLLQKFPGYQLVDLDDFIANKIAHSSIPTIIGKDQNRREDIFRVYEEIAFGFFIKQKNFIIIMGAGSITSPLNRWRLRLATVVYLSADINTLLERLNPIEEREKRPLLMEGNLHTKLCEMAQKRSPLYLQSANIVIKTDSNQPDWIAEQVCSFLASTTACEGKNSDLAKPQGTVFTGNTVALLGNSISHSKSPAIHSLFYQQSNINGRYVLFDLAAGFSFDSVFRNLVKRGIKGFNITMPYKIHMMNKIQRMTEYARKAGAINTIKVEDDQCVGENTDGPGFIEDVKCRMRFEFKGKRVLIIGAGGAARGVLMSMMPEIPQEIVIVNRTSEKSILLAQEFSCNEYTLITPIDINGELGEFHLIINATSLLFDDEFLKQIKAKLNDRGICYDLNYRGDDRHILAWSKSHSSNLQSEPMIANGIGMLVGQAARGFGFWYPLANINPREVAQAIIEPSKFVATL